MCYVSFNNLWLLDVKFKIVNFELHITHMCDYASPDRPFVVNFVNLLVITIYDLTIS